MLSSPKALAKVRDEARGLENAGTWDLSTVMELDDLRKQTRCSDGAKVIIGQLMAICSVKYAEMDESKHVLKGRVVFRGDCAKDESGKAAIYQDLAATPTAINSANANIAYGMLRGNKTTSADAVKAYIQSELKSQHPTYVELPKELHPPEWNGRFKRPVVRLVKSLYGHPEAGAHWQRHLECILKELGGEDVDGHSSTFFFSDSSLLLTVYVDDFILSGPCEKHEPFWTALSAKVNLEAITGLERFLGRYHELVSLGGKPGIAFAMTDYVKSACELYESLPGAKALKAAPTPFVPDGGLLPDDDNVKGELSDNACKMLMKCLWVARLARPDLLRPITVLATKIQAWTVNCDKQLYRLMCYMSSSSEYKLVGQVLDDPSQLELVLYVDADFAGDRQDAKSTSGGYLVLQGPSAFFPICWTSKKQTSVSRSTTEAELVSLAYSLFGEAIPMLSLWERLLKRPVTLRILEDNEATIKVIKKGYSSKLRHLSRTQRVNIASIHESLLDPQVILQYVESSKQAADVFTKSLDPQKWGNALSLLGVHPNLSASQSKT
jgi:hypothetical protein